MRRRGQLRLDAKAAAARGGVSGRLFAAGKGKESLLFRRIAGGGDDDRMPLDDEPLTGEQIETIRRWIDQGAKWPDGVGAVVEVAAAHWAYVPPESVPSPDVSDPSWVAGPIDALVLRRLEREGLSPISPRGKGKAAAAGLSRSHRPAAHGGGGRGVSGRRATGRLRAGGGAALGLARPMASGGRGRGSIWPATPTATATRRTSSAASGRTATG